VFTAEFMVVMSVTGYQIMHEVAKFRLAGLIRVLHDSGSAGQF
jgi:hypothetical protein